MTWKWGVFLADLNPTLGSEQQGKRPVLVVSDEVFSSVMPVVTILPITSLKPGREVYPNEVRLSKGTAGLAMESLVLAHQIRTISKQRLQGVLGFIQDISLQKEINKAMKVHLNV